jgi:RNA polymerase sigma-70 factor, ECF subfamily
VPDEADQRSDSELIAATATGDRAAFGVLVGRYQRPILHLANALVRDRQHAEDILQDTFLSAFRAAGSYRGDAPVANWLYAIARHAAYRLVRRSQEVASDERSIERLGELAGWGAPDVERAAAQAELRTQLDAALATLLPEEREVITLRDALGMSGQQTALMVGCSVAAMKSRLHRARLHLAAELRSHHGGANVAR